MSKNIKQLADLDTDSTEIRDGKEIPMKRYAVVMTTKQMGLFAMALTTYLIGNMARKSVKEAKEIRDIVSWFSKLIQREKMSNE